MTAIWPLGNTTLERQDDELDAAARDAPQLATRNSRDLGSFPEPGERVTTLSVFRESCEVYYSNGGAGACEAGRIAAQMHFKDHVHSSDLARWWRRGWPLIVTVLARIEREVKER